MGLFKYSLFALALSLALPMVAEAKTNARWDKNGDGKISRSEWRGNNISFRAADRNGDGVISRAESLRAGSKISKRNNVTEANRFDRLDDNDNGWVTLSEWDGTSSVFDRLDKNNDERLSRTEFDGSTAVSANTGVTSFDRMDSNNDGRVTRSEWTGTSSTFTSLDDNDDNRLTVNEYNNLRSENIIDRVVNAVTGN